MHCYHGFSDNKNVKQWNSLITRDAIAGVFSIPSWLVMSIPTDGIEGACYQPQHQPQQTNSSASPATAVFKLQNPGEPNSQNGNRFPRIESWLEQPPKTCQNGNMFPDSNMLKNSTNHQNAKFGCTSSLVVSIEIAVIIVILIAAIGLLLFLVLTIH